MTHRKTVKHTRKRGMKKRIHKKAYSTFVNKIPKALHMPIPQVFIGNFETTFWGILAAGSGGPTQYFTMYPASFYIPMDTPTSFTGMTGGTLVPATHALNALNPTGWTAMSGLYTKYCVFDSSISVTCSPSAVVDIAQLVLYPDNVDDTTITDSQMAAALPYSKAIVVTSNNVQTKNTVSMKLNHAKFLGQPRALYEAQNTTGFGFQINAIKYNVVFQLFNSSGSPSNNLCFEVKLNQRVKLTEPLLFTN